MFWSVVVRVSRDVAHILRWSWWRRWHQAWAAWYHARRRSQGRTASPAKSIPESDPPTRSEATPRSKPTEAPTPTPEGKAGTNESHAAKPRTDPVLLDTLWARLEPLLPAPRRSGRPPVYDRRTILEAIVYVMQTDCGWKALPSCFPPWKTVHEQFVAWRKAGIWDRIWQGLTPPEPHALE